jgi:hypothetical protein
VVGVFMGILSLYFGLVSKQLVNMKMYTKQTTCYYILAITFGFIALGTIIGLIGLIYGVNSASKVGLPATTKGSK